MSSLWKQSRALLTIPVLSEPSRRAAAPVEEPSEEYIQLSNELGINQIPLRLVELAQVVREETLGVYPYEEVVRCLDKQVAKLAGSQSKTWHFLPDWSWHPVKEYSSRHYRSGSHFESSIYNKPLPSAVMRAIDRIVDRFPGAEFHVTDIPGFQEYKDRFLAVTLAGSDTLYVVERWTRMMTEG